MRQFFNSKKEAIGDSQHLLYMEFKRGRNLTNFLKQGDFFKLSESGLSSLFKLFGEVAGYDLIIANCDRFLPANFRGDIQKNHIINTGNIMIEVKSLDLKDIEVHVIDNAPHFVSFFISQETAKAKDSSSGDYNLCFFSGGSVESSSSNDDDNGNFPQVALSVNPRPERSKDFKYFIEGDEKVLELMAEQVIVGFENETSKLFKDTQQEEALKFFKDQSMRMRMKVGFVEGLQDAQKKIKAIKIDKIMKQVFDSRIYTHKTVEVLKEFIVSNFELVRN